MAQLISVKLSRFDASPWGFRLQGGKDFGAPLLIQKVNGGSLAEKAGLQAGDAVIRVNDAELFHLRHKEAQDYIVRAGNNFELTVQRGGSTWKPQVTPVGPAPVNFTPASNIQPVTKTSLAAKKQDGPHIGGGHNFAPKPYGGPQVNGISDPTVKSIVNKQYNTPVGIYSEETIAETLSAQAEVLAGGVLGVNFKKNERIYNAANSEVLKMVQEIDSEPRELEPALSSSTSYFATSSHAVGGRATSPCPLTPLAQQLPAPSAPSSYLPTNVPLDIPKCSDCERAIVGVFVRIKDKNLHVECFKCATCGTSLKNVGYYNINNKLYCDIHAKLVARQNPPAPNLEPVTVPPGSRVPAGTISAALAKVPASPASNFAPAPVRVATAPTYAPAAAPAPASPGNLSPQPGTLGPLPFHPVHQQRISENNFVTENNMKNIITALPALHIDDSDSEKNLPVPVTTRPNKAPSNLAGPKPFSTPSAPITSPARPAPVPNAGGGGIGALGGTQKGASFAGSSAPRRGRGVLTQQSSVGVRIALCARCSSQIRGPFITALGKNWCPDHFVCVNAQCHRPLADIGFVEEKGELYCEYCFEKYLAPSCDKCSTKVKGDCLNAIGKHFHPECFLCAYCGKLFGNNPFFLEDGLPYCETDWNELFTTKCFACGFPIEAGDRWVEALSNNYHSQCFNCTNCKKNLEGQSFYAKGGRPFCKAHAR
ncbi:PDZ and LIM domain protein Zasp isoform X4 [Zootermopsis nevadensis]|uniref:PDZ and LIM domain protein Zasp isoform X4 n=1 Tax=Zootermopsis nevadensis TaxID=136037 RepID=UPI000B8EE40F|nr:PDZ and LIM domain protein Zasp isoform X4 [Zootermopsis nevadensis]